MSEASPSQLPALTPQFCFSPTALRDFLRLSRATLDDPITSTLNTLHPHPSFSPSTPYTPVRPSPSSHLIPASMCTSYLSTALFPAWHSRTAALTYCASVASSPDPDDPELLARQMESIRESEKIVNERLDPYSGRFFPKEARTEELARRIREERGVEGVVRGRTWAVIQGRCEGSGTSGEGWEEAVGRWEREREKEKWRSG